ncbi:hypothetical protein [uncultured Clostridium sp.]|uniref:hypothetical protein n=1 Tax=uncultured Clostridium sp. TaxID=59620 RepID=UPI00345A2854
MLDKFNKYIDEYVLYSTVKEPAINNACTMASLHNSIAVDESIEDIINSHGINNLIEDCEILISIGHLILFGILV